MTLGLRALELICSFKNTGHLGNPVWWIGETKGNLSFPHPKVGPLFCGCEAEAQKGINKFTYPALSWPTTHSSPIPRAMPGITTYCLILARFSWKPPSNWWFQKAFKKALHSLVNAFLYKWFNTYRLFLISLPSLILEFWHIIYFFMKLIFCYMKLKLISKPQCIWNIFLSSWVWAIETFIISSHLSVTGWLIVQLLYHTKNF